MTEGISRIGDLELDQDRDFERHEWRAERIGWGVIALIVCTALLGIFSSGPLSGATVGGPEAGVGLRYARFARKMAPTMLEVQVGAAAGSDNEVRVWLSRDYMEQFEVMSVTPEPSRTILTADRLIFVFAVPSPAEATGVTFHLRSERAGVFSARFGLAEGPSFPFHQYVYP